MTRADALGLTWALGTGVLVAVVGPTLPSLGAALGILLLLVADGVARPASGLLVPTISRGSRDRRSVALTFDDGPDPRATPQIADTLAAYDARATFFCIGRRLEEHPAIARRLVAEGHELANHSFLHSRTLNFRGPSAMDREIAAGAAAVRAACPGGAEPLYRPPIGLKSPPLSRVAARRGLRVVTWSVHGRDTGGATAQAIARRILARVGPGDIVLLHDGSDRDHVDRSPTADALPLVLQGLKDAGLTCVTVSELLDPAGEPVQAPPGPATEAASSASGSSGPTGRSSRGE